MIVPYCRTGCPRRTALREAAELCQIKEDGYRFQSDVCYCAEEESEARQA